MQRLITALRGVKFGDSRPIPTGPEVKRRELKYAIAGIVVLLVGFIALGALTLVPIGKRTYSAELRDAGSIQMGDDVRVAGVPAGKITGITLRDDHVDLEFTVDKSVFLGNATTLEVRMLTAVGGHYLAVFPAGDKPLTGPIPPDHVKLPYSLNQAFQDAAQPLAAIDGNTLRANFAAVENALNGAPEAVHSVGHAVSTLVDILDKQNDDVSRTLRVADDYLAALNSVNAQVLSLIDAFSQIETQVGMYHTQADEALGVTNRLLARIAAVVPSWDQRVQPILDALHAQIPRLKDIGARTGSMLTKLRDAMSAAVGAVGPNGLVVASAANAARLTPICIPVAGRAC